MGSRQFVHVVPLPIRRPVPVKTGAIPRGHPSFYEANRISGEVVDMAGRAGAPLVEERAQPDHDDEQRSAARLRRRPHRSKLVERLIAQNGQGFVGVGNGQHDDRPLAFP